MCVDQLVRRQGLTLHRQMATFAKFHEIGVLDHVVPAL
jgi:hypothetical protein